MLKICKSKDLCLTPSPVGNVCRARSRSHFLGICKEVRSHMQLLQGEKQQTTRPGYGLTFQHQRKFCKGITSGKSSYLGYWECLKSSLQPIPALEDSPVRNYAKIVLLHLTSVEQCQWHMLSAGCPFSCSAAPLPFVFPLAGKRHAWDVPWLCIRCVCIPFYHSGPPLLLLFSTLPL